jgi:hypothetical protein
MGERLPSDFWRIDVSKCSYFVSGSYTRTNMGTGTHANIIDRLTSVIVLARRVPEGMPMKRPFSSYWRTNIWETTSGNFWTELLDFHRSVLGEDRILYSVDYPFVMMQQGAEWVESLHQNRSTKLDFIRNHAIKILKLDA